MSDLSVPREPLPSPTPEATPPPVPSSPRAKRIRRIATALLALLVLAAIVSFWAYDTLPKRVDKQQTFVFGQTQFEPGGQAVARILVRNALDSQPIPDAEVRVSLKPKEGGRAISVFQGKTDKQGALGAEFVVPQDAAANSTLLVEARSPLGRDQVKQDVSVKRSYKLLLTTDKPVYQPAQTIHMRALALSALDMRAIKEGDIDFLVEDPKGNKVFRRTVSSSSFGVAAADFVLADELLHGDYKITVSLGDTSSEKTVSVKRYVLPKFAIKVNTERTYYLLGQRVAGTVQCDYFFGKPVVDGQVEIVGTVFDVQEAQVVNIQGRTGPDGAYRFEFDLPQYFAGRGLEKDQADFSLKVSVVDQAEHTEQTSKVLPIAKGPIVIEVVPEAGTIKPGVENKLYILTSYPDGTPARTRLSLQFDWGPAQLTTGEYGLAEYAFTPSKGYVRIPLLIIASDEKGQSAQKQVDIEAETGMGVVLLRPERAIYRLGDTMRLVVLTSVRAGSVFLDIVKGGQTLSTRALDVDPQSGKAECAVDLSGDLFGTLTLHAYKVLADGSLIRDTRVVAVDAPRDVTTQIEADREVYRPGEMAKLSFRTRTSSGPVQSALGIAIVDESVFAVMEQDPGFAKLYFLLQKELLEPKYQVKGFTLPEVFTSTEDLPLRNIQDSAARAAWAPLPAGAMAMSINSRPPKIEAAQFARAKGLNRISSLYLLALLLPPLGLWITVILGLRATGILNKALGRFALTLLVLTLGGPFLCVGIYFFIQAGGGLIAFLILAGFLLSWLVSFIAFSAYAWGTPDARARIVWLFVVAWVALAIVLVAALAQGTNPNGWLAAWAVLAYLGGLLALLLFGAGLYLEGRRRPSIFVHALALLFIPAVISAAALPTVARYSSLIKTLGDPAVYVGPLGWLSGCSPRLIEGSGLGRGLFGLPGAVPVEKVVKETVVVEAEAQKGKPEQQAAGQAPRVRQFFPETLLWLPELVTDQGGFASLEVPMADSITTWRATVLASTQEGQFGFSNAALRVFQDFFVDIDLPVVLTQNDEVSIPVAVYNYLREPQDVRLEVAPAGWFELQDQPTKSLRIAANDIEVVYFRLKVLQFGEQAFQVTAWGERMSDAIRRSVTVVPDGRLFRRSKSDWLREDSLIRTNVPAEAITGTARIEVKVYPGVVSQVVEGLEKILRLPYG